MEIPESGRAKAFSPYVHSSPHPLDLATLGGSNGIMGRSGQMSGTGCGFATGRGTGLRWISILALGFSGVCLSSYGEISLPLRSKASISSSQSPTLHIVALVGSWKG